MLLTRLCRHIHYSSVVDNVLHKVRAFFKASETHVGARDCPRDLPILRSVHITPTSQEMAVYCASAGQSIFLILWRFMTMQTAVVAPRLSVCSCALFGESMFECNLSQS